MKKINKKFMLFFNMIFIITISLIAYNVLAEENLKVVDMEYSKNEDWTSSILYSDKRLLMWDSTGGERIVENVVKRQHLGDFSFVPDYLTTNNELFYNVNSQTEEIRKVENVIDFKTGFIGGDKTIAYKDTNNSLYYIKYNESTERKIILSDYQTYNFMQLLELFEITHDITDYEETDNQVPIYMVLRSDCNESKAFIEYLSTLKSTEYNKFKIIGIDIDRYDNHELIDAIQETFYFQIESVPTIIIGEEYLVGYSESNKEQVLTSVDFMYEQEVDERADFIKEYNSKLKIEAIKIADNVDQFEINVFDYWGYIMYTTTDKNAYVFGENYINVNINDGDDFTTPYLLMENVKEIGEKYLITDNNDIYIFVKYNRELVPLQSDVSTVLDIDSNRYRVIYNVKNSSNDQKYIYYQINSNSSYVSYYGPQMKDVHLTNYIYYDTKFLLSEDGVLYTENMNDNTGLTEIRQNVKEISRLTYDYAGEIYILDNNGNLYYKCVKENNCYSEDLVTELTSKSEFKKNEEYLVLTDVESIKYLNKRYILMNDGSIYRFGSNLSNEFKNLDLSYSDIPIKLDELINNGKEIKAESLKISLNKNDAVVDEVIKYDMITIPANASEEINLSIENSEIIKRENLNLRTIKEGSTNICAVSANDEKLKDCQTVNVYPKITKISIEQDEISLGEYETKVIEIKYEPSNALLSSINLGWLINDEIQNDSLELEFGEYYDYNRGEYVSLKPNQIAIEGNIGGTHKLEIYQVGCDSEDCSDKITVNVEEGVSYIEVDIDKEFYDGINNAYMFMNEKDTLQVNYKIYHETATNKKVKFSSSDNTIASIDENGLITAHKPGKVTIDLESEDGFEMEWFYLTVYDYTKTGTMKGDVNKDGEVNILDIIKLRKYLAGLEELDE